MLSFITNVCMLKQRYLFLFLELYKVVSLLNVVLRDFFGTLHFQDSSVIARSYSSFIFTAV